VLVSPLVPEVPVSPGAGVVAVEDVGATSEDGLWHALKPNAAMIAAHKIEYFIGCFMVASFQNEQDYKHYLQPQVR
jgi:hypothetical protein